MTRYNVALLPGDGVGPEVLDQGIRVLDAAGEIFGVELEYERLESGATRWQRTGTAISDGEFELARASDAMYMGAIGLPEARHPDGREVSGDVMFGLRFGLDLYAGVRPVRTYAGVSSPLVNGAGIDYLVVRENIEGIFASRNAGTNVRDEVVTDTIVTTRTGTEKVMRKAFELAATRSRVDPTRHPKVTCVDKSNVLATYAFFRKIFGEIAAEHPDIDSEGVYVDAMTLYQVQRPQSFDVVVAENLAGDIISDLSSATVGGLGMAPTGDIGDDHAMFQPAHGTAPDIAGQGIANPAATILSGGMLLHWLGQQRSDDALLRAGDAVDAAVAETLANGSAATRDLGGTATTETAGQAVIAALRAAAE
ncbi:MAG TPA: isocitrate/isopropylmalate dehydrogenase family protein [Lacisediminihabitans sp.]|uniref:isocitrate/isopropylmalate dehydrogenase family protein n=1 Tax=Lacisediminihabitans sp. TaxID=2787631 RepID=UPI002ED990E0